jgi:hypothetical protein
LFWGEKVVAKAPKECPVVGQKAKKNAGGVQKMPFSCPKKPNIAPKKALPAADFLAQNGLYSAVFSASGRKCRSSSPAVINPLLRRLFLAGVIDITAVVQCAVAVFSGV